MEAQMKQVDIRVGFLVFVLLAGNGCATALINEYNVRQAQGQRAAVQAMVRSVDGATDATIGIDVTRLGQVRQAPVQHTAAALFDASVLYFAYDEWGRSSGSGGAGYPDGPFAMVDGSRNELSVSAQQSPPSFVVRGDNNRVVVGDGR